MVKKKKKKKRRVHEILTKDINIDIIPGQLGKQIERPHLGSYHLRDTSYIVATIYLFIYFFWPRHVCIWAIGPYTLI